MQNLIFGTDTRYERLPQLAAELVDRKVAVIASAFFPATLAAKAATSTIPIVFISGVDPVAAGPRMRPADGGRYQVERVALEVTSLGTQMAASRSASLLRSTNATHATRSRRPSSRQEQNVARLDVGSPARILTEGGDRRQCRDLLAALDDEGLVAKALTDRCRIGGRILVRTGQ